MVLNAHIHGSSEFHKKQQKPIYELETSVQAGLGGFEMRTRMGIEDSKNSQRVKFLRSIIGLKNVQTGCGGF